MASAESLLQRSSGGHKPPDDIPPGVLLQKLMSAERPSDVYEYPRRGDDGKGLFEYALQILTQDELDNARANAEAYTRKKLKETAGLSDDQMRAVRTEAWGEIYQDALCYELLWQSCREKDAHDRRVFTAPSTMRKLVTTDEAAAMFQQYQQTRHRYGPLWRELSDDEVDAWVEMLVKGAADYPFSQLGPGERAQLIVSLAFRLRESRTDIGSAGSPSSG